MSGKRRGASSFGTLGGSGLADLRLAKRDPPPKAEEPPRPQYHHGATPLEHPRPRVSLTPPWRDGAPPSSEISAGEDESKGPVEFEVQSSGMWVEGRRADVRRGLIKDLKRGRWTIQARLDLHGLLVAEARRAVERFLRDAERTGIRAVLIVTGKGEHSRSLHGVLRQGLCGWLTDDPCRSRVLCFTSARPQDGGPGAFYVLLRRADRTRVP